MNAVHLKNYGLVPPRFIIFPSWTRVVGIESACIIRLKAGRNLIPYYIFDFPEVINRGSQVLGRKGKISVSPYIPSLMI